MADVPDITDPQLPAVTEPTLAPVQETVAELEPVVPNTLDLEPEEASGAERGPARTLEEEPPSAPRPRRQQLKAPVRGDGFDGASLQAVAPVRRSRAARRRSALLFTVGAWALVVLTFAGVVAVLVLLAQWL